METEEEGSRKRLVEYCAEAGRIRQAELAARSGVSQVTISRAMRGVVVASQSQYAILLALNAIRRERNTALSDLAHDEVLWSW